MRFLRLVEKWCYKIQGSTTVKKNNIKSEVKIRGYSAPKLKYIFEIFSQVVILIRSQGEISWQIKKLKALSSELPFNYLYKNHYLLMSLITR